MQNRTVLVTDVRDVVPAGYDSERAVTGTKHNVFDVAAPRGFALDRPWRVSYALLHRMIDADAP